ncbi:MAG: Gfo/Idh/MocA family oxidoreductase, partial [Candidatus Sumerlaeota bacterium]|nr:Gfo/Idh/MocA family oxidoreductase [Candidatus Sumerlaeota bacterium]
MARKPLRVGVIGVGGIGGGHARAVAKHPDMELAAICDVVPDILKRVSADLPKAAVCASLEEFLAVPGLDAAVVATPNNAHAKYTIACANAGLHVLCEKPLGMNVREVVAMRDA